MTDTEKFSRCCIGVILLTIVMGFVHLGCDSKKPQPVTPPPKEEIHLRFDVKFMFNGKEISTSCLARETDCGVALGACDNGFGYACVHSLQYTNGREETK